MAQKLEGIKGDTSEILDIMRRGLQALSNDPNGNVQRLVNRQNGIPASPYQPVPAGQPRPDRAPFQQNRSSSPRPATSDPDTPHLPGDMQERWRATHERSEARREANRRTRHTRTIEAGPASPPANTRTVIIRPDQVVLDQPESPAGQRERDSRGRFVRRNTRNADEPLTDQQRRQQERERDESDNRERESGPAAGRRGLPEVHAPDNMDPVIEAIRETGIGKAYNWIARKTRRDRIPKEQKDANKRQEKLLARIARALGRPAPAAGSGMMGMAGRLMLMALPAILSGVVGFMGLMIPMVLAAGSALFPAIMVALAGFVGYKFGQWLEPRLQALGETIGGAVFDFFDPNNVQSPLYQFRLAITNGIESVVTGFKSAAEAIQNIARSIIDSVSNWIRQNVPGFQQGGIVDRAASAAGGVVSAAGGLLQQGMGWVQNKLGIGGTQGKLPPGKNLSQDKLASIQRVANNIGVDPNDLAAIISFETGGTFSPGAKNKNTSATGLIQFMKDTDGHKGYYGMSRNQFASLSFDDQMNYVQKYFQARGFRAGQNRSVADAYTAVTGYGYKAGSRAYELNQVWDSNKDGYIAKGEMVQNKNFRAHQKDYFGARAAPVAPIASTGSAQPMPSLPVTAPVKPPIRPTVSPVKGIKPAAIKPAAIPKRPAIPETRVQVNSRVTAQAAPVMMQEAPLTQNVADRGLAHAMTGGLGSDRFSG